MSETVLSSLKATRGPLAGTWPSAGKEDWQSPPPDGSPLADFYNWEERRVSAMREGRAGPWWYLWEPQLSLSLGRREARRIGWPFAYGAEEVAVRATGGTAVPQGPGTLNLTLFTLHPERPGIESEYARTTDALSEAFQTLGHATAVGARPGSFCDGAHNLLLGGRKLVGTAQRWAVKKGGGAVGHHHNVILSGGDPEALCARVENLLKESGLPESYDPAVHSGVPIDKESLRRALAGPLAGRI